MLQWNRRHLILLVVVAAVVAFTLLNGWLDSTNFLDWNGVTLAFVFGVSAVILFGWAGGVLVVFATPAILQTLEHRPPVRIAYNAAAFAATAATAGAALDLLY